MQAMDPTHDEAIRIARAWWLFALVGLASLVAGIIFVAKPSHSLNALAVVAGIFLLVDGIAELVASFGDDAGDRALAAIIGVIGIVIGVILIRHPSHAVTAIGLLIGIWLVAAGVIRLVRAIVIRDRILLRVAIALVEIVVGIAVVSSPHIGYVTLALLVGIWLIVNGIGTMAVGFLLRSDKSDLTASAATG